MQMFPERAQAATVALRVIFAETPLQRKEHLSARYDADIWLKREDLSPVRSYKLRKGQASVAVEIVAQLGQAPHPKVFRSSDASAARSAAGVSDDAWGG